MTTIELKSNFHHLIDVIQDDRMLQDMYDCIADFAIRHETKLSKTQIERMKLSLQQIENGQIISNQHVKEELRQWLTK